MSDTDNKKTRLIRKAPGGSGGSGSDTTRPARRKGPLPSEGGDEDTNYPHFGRSIEKSSDTTEEVDGTRILTKPGATPPPPVEVPDGATVLVRPSSSARKKAKGGEGDESQPGGEPAALPDGPVVGWLVVVGGPGWGHSVRLGYGMNQIGRHPENRVCLPFGDEEISRKKHAVLTYDPRGKKYYLQQGESSNLTYLGDAPVLAPVELKGGETIRIGSQTELRFVPLCGEDFDWGE